MRLFLVFSFPHATWVPPRKTRPKELTARAALHPAMEPNGQVAGKQGCYSAGRQRSRVTRGFQLLPPPPPPRAAAAAEEVTSFLGPLCRASHHSHEVHLPQRKSAVADKPTHAHFSPEHYTGPAPRRQASARSPPPFAAEQGGSPADPAAPARYLQPHTPPQPSGKVSATAFAAEAYSSALQASATARQQRYAAAAGAQAPFAVKAGEGGVAEAEGVHAHLERPPQKDPSAKVRGCSRPVLGGH